MRLWHLALMILVSAVILAIARELMGRVILVFLLTGTGTVVLSTTAALCLFQTVGAFGEARGLSAQARAIGATVLVLVLVALATVGVVAIGMSLLKAVVG